MIEATGVAFDIRRHAIHDGPGIRVAVFMKGCPLSCPWCHNPEGMAFEKELLLRPERCLSCGACKAACPAGTAAYGSGPCLTCGACAAVCPNGAREAIGTAISVAEVMALARADEPFFDESDGGITFTGGEPLAQGDFVLAATCSLSEKGYRVAIDTSGYAETELVRSIARYADLFLYDIKYMDDEKHIELVGVSNKIIHDNIRMLADAGANVTISVPLIPGYNDDTENLKATARFIASLKPSGRSAPYPVRILPFHDSARNKYARRGLAYPCKDVAIPTPARVGEAVAIFSEQSIDTIIGGLS